MNADQATSPLKAIKLHCRVNCCANDMESWRDCNITDCQLHPFRFGKNPFRKKRELTQEQREAIGERLKTARGEE